MLSQLLICYAFSVLPKAMKRGVKWLASIPKLTAGKE